MPIFQRRQDEGTGEALHALAAQGGVRAKQQATTISPDIIAWAQRDRTEDGALPEPDIGVLKGHDLAGMDSCLIQGKLGKMVHQATFECFRAALDALPEAGRPPGEEDPFARIDARDMAKA